MSRFKNAPIQRHPALQPLSRDHYDELLQAQRLVKGAKAKAKDRQMALKDFFDIQAKQPMDDHFAEEEKLLITLMDKADVHKMLSEHKQLLAMANQAEPYRQSDDPDQLWMEKFGQALNKHIRWEERELFPKIQNSATDAQLEALGKQTALIEKRRDRCSPRTTPR